MERADNDEDTEGEGASSRRSSVSQASDSTQTERTEDAVISPRTEKKQKKHGRVQKREKELYGLVTPVFLPLLDARETPSPEKSHHHHHNHTKQPPALSTDTTASTASTPSSEPATPASNAPQSGTPSPKTSSTTGAMPGETPAPAPVLKERSLSDPGKKSRRSSIKKKSALRHNSTSTNPRNHKRVSLVIDDVVVLPSDIIQEPVLMSPSSETTSLETSTASLDDLIDPRLTADTDGPVYTEHTGTVHHSLTPGASANPAMARIPVVAEAAHSPPTPDPRLPPATPFAPPSYATRTFLDPAPERLHVEESAGPEAILASPHDSLEKAASMASTTPADDPEDFQTYVGGISGSGVADVNQVGSVGYPSSLGASYLESYMQGRPLSVRMAAAEREGDSDELRRLRGMEERRKVKEREKEEKRRIEEEDEWEKPAAGKSKGNEDDDGFMGSMDDF